MKDKKVKIVLLFYILVGLFVGMIFLFDFFYEPGRHEIKDNQKTGIITEMSILELDCKRYLESMAKTIKQIESEVKDDNNNI
jgi:hypothetical protein